jgi:hypothetical protein
MISKEKLKENVSKTKNTTKEALTTIYKALNNGQQKKLLKNEEVKRLLEFYGVIDSE